MINALYKFDGEITAVSPLAVNRPGDNFLSPRGSERLRRLPRVGIKQDNSPIYFPATTLRRLFRESAYHVVREAIQRDRAEPPFTLNTHMMLSSGVDITNQVQHESAEGRIDGERLLRERNPLLSLFGRWKLAGHLHVGNAIPADEDSFYIEGTGARQNDFERHPELAELLSAEDAERLRQLMRGEVMTMASAPAIDEPVSVVGEKNGVRKKSKAPDLIDKVSESIRRPLEGFEAIRAGTVMRHAMRLDCGSPLELGLLLASFREASRRPLVGGHRNLGCGEISANYEIKSWKTGADVPDMIGSVTFGFDGFVVEGYELKRALMEWDNKAKNICSHFDFNRFLIKEEVA